MTEGGGIVDIAYQGRKFRVRSKKMVNVREYNPFSGWFLSLFNIAFKTLDARGKTLYLNRKSFCKWMLEQENEKRIQLVSKNAFYQALQPGATSMSKRASRLDLPQVMRIFKREMNKLSLSLGGHSPNIHALFDAMEEELRSH